MIEWQALPGTVFYDDLEERWLPIRNITLDDIKKVGTKYILRIDDIVFREQCDELTEIVSKIVMWDTLQGKI